MMTHSKISQNIGPYPPLTGETIAACLQPVQPDLSQDAELRQLIPSAVIVPLIATEEEWQILFIRRSEQVGSHRGQIAFPGGRRESQDPSDLATALREVQEELGVIPQTIAILGALSPCATASGFWIQPYVGHLQGDTPFVPDDREVSETFALPLRYFLGVSAEWGPCGPAGKVGHCYRYGDRVIWGATATILSQLVQLLQSGLAS